MATRDINTDCVIYEGNLLGKNTLIIFVYPLVWSNTYYDVPNVCHHAYEHQNIKYKSVKVQYLYCCTVVHIYNSVSVIRLQFNELLEHIKLQLFNNYHDVYRRGIIPFKTNNFYFNYLFRYLLCILCRYAPNHTILYFI